MKISEELTIRLMKKKIGNKINKIEEKQLKITVKIMAPWDAETLMH